MLAAEKKWRICEGHFSSPFLESSIPLKQHLLQPPHSSLTISTGTEIYLVLPTVCLLCVEKYLFFVCSIRPLAGTFSRFISSNETSSPMNIDLSDEESKRRLFNRWIWVFYFSICETLGYMILWAADWFMIS